MSCLFLTPISNLNNMWYLVNPKTLESINKMFCLMCFCLIILYEIVSFDNFNAFAIVVVGILQF